MREYTEQEKYFIWLASVIGVTPKLFYYIVKEFGSPALFFDAVERGSVSPGLIADKVMNAAREACSKQYITEMICALNAKGIHAVTRLSEDYPPLLKNIAYPPPVLYVKGSLEGLKHPFSIVGTRRASRKGVDLTKRIAYELGQSGLTVVSGMARGIDTAAHEGAIDAGAKTIAVLGCGVDVIYPPESEDIYHQALETGAVVSELAPGSQPYAANFPARNRIITGMAMGTLIVESEMKGGTAISAGMAISQGRDIFAVPGNPLSAMASLPNTLIRQGAAAVACGQDILEFYGFINRSFTKDDGKPSKDAQLQLDFLQRQIYNLLLQGDMSVESIANCIEYPQNEINVTLTMMELGGIIKRLPGGKYGI